LRAGTAEASARARTGLAGVAAVGFGVAAFGLAKLPSHGMPWFGIASALAAVLALAAMTPALLATALPRLRAMLLRQGLATAGIAAGALAGALRRSAVLVAALATAIGVMLGVAIMVGSFRQTVQIWIGQQLQGDVFIRPAEWDRNRIPALAPRVVAAILATPGVATVEANHTQAWSFRGEPIFIGTRWALTPKARGENYRLLAGRAGAVMVSEPFARRFDVWAGEAITLNAPNGALSLKVAGVFYDYSNDRGLIALDRPTFAQGFGSLAITALSLGASAHVTASDLRRRVELRLRGQADLEINDNATLRAETLRVFDETFRITYALEAITLLVAILGVGNTLLAVVLERAHELATLRFLGAMRRQIRTLLLIESGMVGTFALGIGWGMGAILALILVRVINVESFGWTIQFHIPYGFLVTASALVWVATLAAGWLPAGIAQRQAAPSSLGVE
ncbi:MAG: ABC transporter permease, partial [Terriglobales bacterium]